MKYIGKLLTIFLGALLLCGGFTVYAKNSSKTVVTIGFPIQRGTSYMNQRGDYAGYLVDYLHQLEFFTNWDVEFVQVEGDLDTQLDTLMDMLRDGKIDMLGTMNRDPELEEMFLYPSYSYGTTYTTLGVLEEDLRWIEEDFSHWDNIRVAIDPGYKDHIDQFVYYAMVNDFSYTLVQCETYEEMIEAVRSGQADALIQKDISLTDGFRIVGRFSPSPYYFALSPDNTELLQQLDTAMRSLNTSQPNLQIELYELYFRQTDNFQISDEHRRYVQSLDTMKVLFFDGNAPYQYVKDGELKGFAVEYLQRFAEITGLKYEPVIAKSYEEIIPLVENGEVDLVACIPTNSSLSSQENIRFTLPFFNSFSVTACDNHNPHQHPSNLEFRINTEQALYDIQHTKNYGVQLDYYSLVSYLQKPVIYDDLVIDWGNTKNFSYVTSVAGDVPDGFVAILNQYISSISDNTRQTMLYRYSGDDIDYTLGEWFQAYGLIILGCGVVILFVICGLLLYLRNKRITYKALAAENRLMHLAMYDEVTGAYNEPYFRKMLEETCEKQEKAALIAFNIRSFKYINDTYGTKRADEMLCGIKHILESQTKQGEFFCRPSADLFYLVLKEESADSLIPHLDDIFSKIRTMGSVILDGHPLSIYCGAVFIADSPSPYCASSNMSYMMAALSHARQMNIDTTYIFDEPLYRREQLRYYIETHMRSALVKQEYQLYLQPKMNLQTGRVDGAEALVRWQPTDRGMIFPDQFIPIFEENGFCVQLDLYMVEQVCNRLRFWMEQGISPIVISVNQTKSLFVKEDYVEKLLEITNKYQISPQYIILEIPEGLAFENIGALNHTIRKLNDAGFRVSMDDFGSGYSSLNTLGKLQINELKLDRMFLKDVVNDKNGSQSAVLSSIFSLAKKLGIQTVAEGVETEESEEMMRSMRCDYGQGYYYSKPIPAEEFQEKFLQESTL